MSQSFAAALADYFFLLELYSTMPGNLMESLEMKFEEALNKSSSLSF